MNHREKKRRRRIQRERQKRFLKRVKKGFDHHHRKPQSRGGSGGRVNGYLNVQVVPAHQHRCWHVLFRNYEPHDIARIINAIWLDPEYEFVVRRRKPPRGYP